MFFNIVQIATALLLVLLVLVQGKSSGLGSLFGGSGNIYRTKRGAEKLLHYATIIIAIAFFGVSLARFILI